MKIKLHNTISFNYYILKLTHNSNFPRFIRRSIRIHTSIVFPDNKNLMYLSLKNGKKRKIAINLYGKEILKRMENKSQNHTF